MHGFLVKLPRRLFTLSNCELLARWQFTFCSLVVIPTTDVIGVNLKTDADLSTRLDCCGARQVIVEHDQGLFCLKVWCLALFLGHALIWGKKQEFHGAALVDYNANTIGF